MLDLTYKLKFMEVWKSAMNAGYSSNDARDLASLELTGKPFNNHDPNNNYQSNGSTDNCRLNESAE